MTESSRRTFLVTLAVSALGAGLHRSRASAGACAGPRQAVVGVVPGATDVIPRGEGVLVQLVGVTQRSLGLAPERELGAASTDPFAIGARLERDRQRPISLRTELLGPGLARLVPTRAPSAGTWRIVSRGQSVEVQFGAEPAAAIGAAPEVLRVERHVATMSGPGGGGTSTWITATLRTPLGPPWAGTITYVQGRDGAEQAVLARALDQPGTRDVYLYTSPGRCAFHQPDQEPPAAGRDVRLSAYDLWGRISARSAALRVTGQ